MIISMVKYCETFFLKPDITRIFGIPTYDAFHQIQLELKTNALSAHSNLGGATNRHLVLLITNTKYYTLSNVPHVRTVHPSILIIPNNATHILSYELKIVYDKNVRVFHGVRGVKQPITQ